MGSGETNDRRLGFCVTKKKDALEALQQASNASPLFVSPAPYSGLRLFKFCAYMVKLYILIIHI